MPLAKTLIDTHAHLNFQAFKNDFDAVIKSAQKAGIEKIINVGANLESSQKAVEIAQKYSSCFASVGIHPHHAGEQKEGWEEELKELAQNPKIVAIGECGLDYHPYQNGGITNPQIQKEVFEKQLKIACELDLPVIFHCRSARLPAPDAAGYGGQAHQDMLSAIGGSASGGQLIKPFKLSGVFHCFSGDQEFLNQVLRMGFYIGFCGNLTFKNAQELQTIAKKAPLERILIETDCPFLSPEPLRGLRNTPENVKLIAEFLAQLRKLSFEEICQITTENAEKVFPKIR